MRSQACLATRSVLLLDHKGSKTCAGTSQEVAISNCEALTLRLGASNASSIACQERWSARSNQQMNGEDKHTEVFSFTAVRRTMPEGDRQPEQAICLLR